MNNRRYQIGQRIQNQQFANSHHQGDLPINWGSLLYQPLYLYKVWRTDEFRAVGLVRHFNMRKYFRVEMSKYDIQMLEFAQQTKIGNGSIWKPDNKHGYVECELHQYKAVGNVGHFIGFDWIETVTVSVAQKFSYVLDVLKYHHIAQKLCTAQGSFEIRNCKTEFFIRIGCNASDKETLHRYVNPYGGEITIRWQLKPDTKFYGTFETGEQKAEEQAA